MRFALLSLFIVCTVACQEQVQTENAKSESQLVSNKSEAIGFKMESINQNSSKGFYSLKCDYPIFNNIADKEKEVQLNNTIKQFILDQIKGFKIKVIESKVEEESEMLVDCKVNIVDETKIKLTYDSFLRYSWEEEPLVRKTELNYDIDKLPVVSP